MVAVPLDVKANTTLTARIKARARELGFDLVGVTPATPSAQIEFYQRWVEQGYAGQMEYLTRQESLHRRSDPRTSLPEAKSIIVVGLNYCPGDHPGAASTARDGTGKVARYAWNRDYHQVMTTRLRELVDFILGQAERPIAAKISVDTGPLLERELAMRAGLGWFGKNTMLINPKLGSWFFLGAVLLDLELDYDDPFEADYCGSCTRCLEVCPTDALLADRTLDATRCISYLTIELKEAIPRELRRGVGGWVFGCDLCQEVCPWNVRFSRTTSEEAFQGEPQAAAPELTELLGLDETTFQERYRGSPLKRAKRRGLLRNAAVALGNLGRPAAIPALLHALEDPEPLVRGHAAWALGQIKGPQTQAALERALAQERDEAVLVELRSALAHLLAEPA